MNSYRVSPILGAPHRSSSFAPCLAALVIAATASFNGVARGQLETIRDEVRNGPPPASAGSDDDGDHHDHRRRHGHGCDDDDVDAVSYATISFFVVTSPFWAPHAAADDSFGRPGYFERFPYCSGPGYMVLATGASPPPVPAGDPSEFREPMWEPPPTDGTGLRTRNWSCRLRAEYADDFDELSRVGAHMLLSSTSRFGLDTGFDYLQENQPGSGQDQLVLGDFNIVFRFAQGERVQFRSGLGLNWLDDEVDTEFGFNFTYGADFFPCRPWVVSATLDWGTLGETDLFRFRSTVGVVFYGIEAYTGYEYLDIGSTQINALVGGVRVWF